MGEMRAGWVKLANRQAGYLSSLSLIRAGGTQRESCPAGLIGYRRLQEYRSCYF
uniref:Uncharacterized protein n=1 Tax=Candidatus Nitrotoga fabula TaxID=2182327 RepID=A0A2X0SL43_9PROT|nr:conserved protein of unknown function [Candidatus Nitrotoga fabula]